MFEGLFRPLPWTSRTGNADEAVRDDDAAAWEYSPSESTVTHRVRAPGTHRIAYPLGGLDVVGLLL
jgi:hypothetical protein